MKRAAFVTFVYCLLWQSAEAQSLDRILGAVSANVENFRKLLPDFVCHEAVTSEAFDDSGKERKSKLVESTFTARHRVGTRSCLR